MYLYLKPVKDVVCIIETKYSFYALIEAHFIVPTYLLCSLVTNNPLHNRFSLRESHVCMYILIQHAIKHFTSTNLLLTRALLHPFNIRGGILCTVLNHSRKANLTCNIQPSHRRYCGSTEYISRYTYIFYDHNALETSYICLMYKILKFV